MTVLQKWEINHMMHQQGWGELPSVEVWEVRDVCLGVWVFDDAFRFAAAPITSLATPSPGYKQSKTSGKKATCPFEMAVLTSICHSSAEASSGDNVIAWRSPECSSCSPSISECESGSSKR
jgi:hypothetical protein